MVGLVVVSHSKALADALVALAQELAPSEASIVVAAGIGQDRLEFGTDAIAIKDAIESVYSPDGVLVIMDLGSAILSAQMAMEFLPPEQQSNVRFCAAPMVEGVLSAAVQISLGADLATVCREATQSLRPKEEMIDPIDAPTESEPVTEPAADEAAHSVKLVLKNEHGLHARPAARFVQTANRFDVDVQVSNLTTGKGPVSARSFNAVATLGALFEHEILLQASGRQAVEALNALEAMVNANFYETQDVESDVPESRAEVQTENGDADYAGVPVSPGIAVGPIHQFRTVPPPIPTQPCDDPAAAWERLQLALQQVDESIAARRRAITDFVGEEHAAIFDAHRLILNDPDLQEEAKRRIEMLRENEAAAWDAAVRAAADQFGALEDVYLKQRAVDVRDVGEQVLFALAGQTAHSVALEHPVILIAEDLTPTQTAQLDYQKILGIMTRLGGPTSHSAILARSLSIPAISGVPAPVIELPDGIEMGMDGTNGSVWVRPSDEKKQLLAERRENWLAGRRALEADSRLPGVTKDGLRVEVAANVGDVNDAKLAVRYGAEGIGLLRTEFLFLSSVQPPDEDEQVSVLREIGNMMGEEKPVIVRTLDVGGDKPLPYIAQEAEANPFLGVRAIRLTLRRPDLFRTQLRAILRAGCGLNFKVMFPMVTHISELVEAKNALLQAHESLAAEGRPHLWPIETGIMIEVPAAALTADAFASQVDFFSIGTNDLTQYTLAAERGNPELAAMTSDLHPAVLRLVKQTVQAAEANGKWVGVCGELAGNVDAVEILLGLGVRELSMTPASIPAVKAKIRDIKLADAKTASTNALKAHRSNGDDILMPE